MSMLQRSVVNSAMHDHRFGHAEPPKVSLSAINKNPLKTVMLSCADLADK